jgi:hypothetical protein
MLIFVISKTRTKDPNPRPQACDPNGNAGNAIGRKGSASRAVSSPWYLLAASAESTIEAR